MLNRHHSIVELLLGLALMTLVLARQCLAMLDNQRLLVALAEARDQLEHQALHDALTGLPNRVLFADRLDRALLQPEADVSVLFCDLDDFKLVNDQHGHDAGDRLLRLVAERLLECVRLTDTVSRLGGDEFAILLEDSANAVQVADRVVAAIEPVDLDGRTVQTSISVGIAHHRGPRTEPTRTTAAAWSRQVEVPCPPPTPRRHRAAGVDRRPAAASTRTPRCTPRRVPARAGRCSRTCGRQWLS